MALPAMKEGGLWVQPSHNGPALYVTHEAHIKRLMTEGARPIPDPRVEPVVPVSEPEPEQKSDNSKSTRK